ncbi:MAG: RNA polymerase sigma-70 factor [Prolixibacteraceae bacterium]|jgi:RNA polymerase sigma-70 factor (ECF subfamily)|nr:RNA polymerase sigma-70 factor [Prolixibacteraceae bacterium]
MPGKDTHTDEELITKIKLGDENAFRMLYEKYCRQLIRFAASYLPDISDAEEIIQNVFVELWERREQLDPERFVKNYLYRVTVNKVYNHLKRKVVERKYLQCLDVLETNTINEAEKKIYREELAGAVNHLLDRLPEQQRVIFYLSRWEGLSHKEIADQLQISVRTVENQVYRAVKYIRENIKTDHLVVFLISELMLLNSFPVHLVLSP